MRKNNFTIYYLLILLVILIILLISNQTIYKEPFTNDTNFHHRAVKKIKVSPLSRLPSENDPLQQETSTDSEGFSSKKKKIESLLLII